MNANYFLTFTLRTTTVTNLHTSDDDNRPCNNEDKLNTQHMTVQKVKKKKSSYINVGNKLCHNTALYTTFRAK